MNKLTFKVINFSLISVLIACGKKENVNPEFVITDDKTSFVANKYNNFSNLYTFDFDTKKLELILSRTPSGDANVYQKMNDSNGIEGFYFAERFLSSPTRITYLKANKKTSGIENTNFPINIHNLIMFKNKLLGIGYEAEIIASSPDLSNTFISKVKLDTGSVSLTTEEKQLKTTHLLTANNKVYVLTLGTYDYAGYQKNKPYIFELADDLKTIVKKTEITNCFNPASQVKVIDTSKVILNCNPYSEDKGLDTNLVYIDVASNNIIIKEILRTDKNGDVQQYELGGVSATKDSILITERKDTGSYTWDKINSAYWFDLNNPETIVLNEKNRKKYVKSLAGKVTYNYSKNMYLFSCVVDPASFTCINGKAAISKDLLGEKSEIIDFNIPEINEIQFPIPIYP
ncbi:hypothetical protein QEJ31_10465 [Pigmentibacter sp. JX0631]|uniref:hypothetical protein n=1 Tax=Pigmentibacter sp. JX0631 TaxID=2976982 RepID=UPI002468B5E7|nr:hypothetical protein [Pigmentibacter sp. JX0631]WGL58943.1 hypothetical protein QEJ31_10465 [Pigmentibacter sp. JX0631]